MAEQAPCGEQEDLYLPAHICLCLTGFASTEVEGNPRFPSVLGSPRGNMLLLGASTDAIPRPWENNQNISQDVSPNPSRARVALAFLFSFYNRVALTSLCSLQKAARATFPDEQPWVSAARAPEQRYTYEEDISYKTFPFAGQINGMCPEAPTHLR